MEAHRAKLAGDLEPKAAPDTRTGAVVERAITSSIPGSLVKQHAASLKAVNSDGSSTRTSCARSVAGAEKLRVPDLPEEACKGPFECPLCFVTIEASTTASWVKHVYGGLRPYVCLSADCAGPDRDKQYWWHVGRHQRELSLFALPSIERKEDKSKMSSDTPTTGPAYYARPYALGTPPRGTSQGAPFTVAFAICRQHLGALCSDQHVLCRAAAMAPSSAVFGALLALARVVRASQPGAVEPVAAPMRDLSWGQLNFLHTTDTHGWLGGHLQEPQYSADWGDYVSFSHHMRKRADNAGADLLVIDTGDRIEGNGLYDASVPKGRFQYDIFAQQNIDVLTIGNHELYKAYSAACEHNTTLPHFKDAYIASNVNYTDPDTGKSEALAQRYRKFKTKNLGLNVVAFGFLFDFTGNANNTIVQPVEETIKELWFQRAMREKPDLFLVIGHVGLRMPEFRAIFTALRKQNWHIPIVFFGGHAHVRDALSYDSQSFAMASGRYLETIGWMSIDGIKPNRKYMDNNLLGMYYHTGLNKSTFPTKQGKHVSNMIAKARNQMRLDDRHGCAPRDLWMNRAEYPSNASIYSWLQNEVLPDVIVNVTRREKARLAILNTGGVRFDIFKGPFTRDNTFTVSPFANSFKFVPDVPYSVAQKVLGILNSADKQMFAPSPATVDEPSLELRSVPEPRPMSRQGSAPDLIAGYTTKDDIGDDGDDTVHEPLTFHHVPNCIQSEIAFPKSGDPDTVDLVFVDFIQPWIVPALKFSGGDFGDGDVQVYMEETLTHKLGEWIEGNWKGDC
ncbi:calcineurin-like phosphoesterase [Hirsutella rhossiliensis]|uniref:Calcineurin-like phosphoesterase domain-containing protein n=1 Tax=Hirsutella rhossiliensis TaxID=111463 RepID=A0A9P8MTL6_9HYPO|nr:calcineurin-like phosphoesterase domain-containing protein [Hirsutella rhossiliensis]KAH0961808.1 calcineurin-like phosphoesterase domain-containing protein [Hirsutella rhossiliensis]